MSMFMQALFEGIINGSTWPLSSSDGYCLGVGVIGIRVYPRRNLMIAMFCSFILICISDLTQSYPFYLYGNHVLALLYRV